MTRMDDILVPLYERVLMAHHHGADQLMSLHADEFSSPNAQGTSVFTLSTRGATSAMARYLSDSENAADIAPGENTRAKDRYQQEVIVDPEQTEIIRESLALGRQIIRHMAPVHNLHTRETEHAAFSVLKSSFIPSVLVEMAFITHPEDEKLLSTSSFLFPLLAMLRKLHIGAELVGAGILKRRVSKTREEVSCVHPDTHGNALKNGLPGSNKIPERFNVRKPFSTHDRLCSRSVHTERSNVMIIHRSLYAGLLLAFSLFTAAQTVPVGSVLPAANTHPHFQVRSADTAELPDEKIQPRVTTPSHLAG
ncbi:hypothetical protein GIJ69_22155 [Enterobacter cancerogenus]|nr:hypothetical protein [Enterobacter cancerogenus]